MGRCTGNNAGRICYRFPLFATEICVTQVTQVRWRVCLELRQLKLSSWRECHSKRVRSECATRTQRLHSRAQRTKVRPLGLLAKLQNQHTPLCFLSLTKPMHGFCCDHWKGITNNTAGNQRPVMDTVGRGLSCRYSFMWPAGTWPMENR